MDEGEDFLKRFYLYREYEKKLALLAEYYKYHYDMPRIFIKTIYKVVFKYHDKIRRLEYYKITTLMENNDQNNNNIKKKNRNLIN